MLAVIALVSMLVGLFTIWSRIGEADRRSPTPAPVREVTRLDAPVTVVTASGTDEAVCKAVIEPYGTGEWDANVLAKGPDGLGSSWLFCQGETGSGIGAIAARSGDNTRWTTQKLSMGYRNHAGDDVRVNIGSHGRASLTGDSDVNTGHSHVWTIDGGKTWFGLLGYQ